jgi:glutamate carboxypeptidase
MSAELLEGVRAWVEIESHTQDIEGVQRLVGHVAASGAAAGAHVERAPAEGYGDHLILRAPWNDGRKGVLVLSHLDTVHPKGTLSEMPFRLEGDSAFGPGIYDMKGGAHGAHRGFCELIAEGRGDLPPLTHLFVSDEEVGSPTSRPLIERLAREAAVVLVTEPAREGGKIVTARKGVARFAVEAKGRPAHSGSRHMDGRSAIREIARIVLALEDMTDYATGLTVNVGTVEGGTGVNVVPARARIEVEARVPTLEAAERIEAVMAGLRPTDPDVTLTVTGGLNRPPYEKSAEIARLFERARGFAAEIGWTLEDLATGGCSDGNFTAPIAPTLDGLGVDGKGGHTDYEQLYVSSLAPRAALVKRLMAEVLA